MATEILRPNAAGDETSIMFQWPGSTYHWDKVDEAVADEGSTEVDTPTDAYQRDLYNLPAHSGSGTINFIKIYIRCLASFADEGMAAKPSLKSDSTVTDGTEIILSTDWTTYSQQWATNPDDSEDWEWDDIDALQIGVSLHGFEEYGDGAFCTQVYVEVDYTEAPVPVADGDLIGIGIIRKG